MALVFPLLRADVLLRLLLLRLLLWLLLSLEFGGSMDALAAGRVVAAVAAAVETLVAR